MRVYNTLSKKKEDFRPIKAGQVSMYTCGPTVYDYVHIGNLRSYLTADILRRTLERSGLTVHQTKNITDVGHLTEDDLAQGDSGEDKIVKKAKAEAKTPADIACFYTEYFSRTEEALNILPASEYPRATEHIEHMIALIEKLIEKGHAYEKNGNVFFDVTSFPAYGALSGNTLEQLKVGARLEEHPDKKNPWDFALWLKAPVGHILRWDSPWGVGYPGWHIECSAMSLATLGESIDIHTGGEDNIFPHHEAEIAQSECANEKPFVRYWLHTRHLLVSGEKMSKSKGNFYILEDILERGYTPMDLRMLFLGSHYRSQMNFTWEALEQAKKNRTYLENVRNRLAESDGTTSNRDFGRFVPEFETALEDDLNTPLALTTTIAFASELNSALDKNESVSQSDRIKFENLLGSLGLESESVAIPNLVQKLLSERERARADKDFTRSDELRVEIENLGYLVEDTAKGQKVRKK